MTSNSLVMKAKGLPFNHFGGEIIIGVLNTVTMVSSNSALKYVSYPTQALAKSTKILPGNLSKVKSLS